jgi:hypothetical protein
MTKRLQNYNNLSPVRIERYKNNRSYPWYYTHTFYLGKNVYRSSLRYRVYRSCFFRRTYDGWISKITPKYHRFMSKGYHPRFSKQWMMISRYGGKPAFIFPSRWHPSGHHKRNRSIKKSFTLHTENRYYQYRHPYYYACK